MQQAMYLPFQQKWSFGIQSGARETRESRRVPEHAGTGSGVRA